jgi:hypothetical protein
MVRESLEEPLPLGGMLFLNTDERVVPLPASIPAHVCGVEIALQQRVGSENVNAQQHIKFATEVGGRRHVHHHFIWYHQNSSIVCTLSHLVLPLARAQHERRLFIKPKIAGAATNQHGIHMWVTAYFVDPPVAHAGAAADAPAPAAGPGPGGMGPGAPGAGPAPGPGNGGGGQQPGPGAPPASGPNGPPGGPGGAPPAYPADDDGATSDDAPSGKGTAVDPAPSTV